MAPVQESPKPTRRRLRVFSHPRWGFPVRRWDLRCLYRAPALCVAQLVTARKLARLEEAPVKRCIVLSLVLGLAATALADPVVWDNGAPNANGNAYSSQRDNVYPFDSQVADDFRLPPNTTGDPLAPTLVTDVHWTGLYFNPGPPGNATAFNILFYNDAGGVPTGGPGDPSGTAFASFNIPIALCNETPVAGTPYFTYDVTLPAGVVVQKNTTYWLAIQS